jgi:tetratricopeptide (TPR) repeat protein
MWLFDEIRSLYYEMKASSSSGKGEKCFRKKEYDRALRYYELSLRYEALSSNDRIRYAASEYCIARTLYELKDYAQALEYAESSYESMKVLKGTSQFLDKKILETKELLDYLRSH